jgi:hypothetical protein
LQKQGDVCRDLKGRVPEIHTVEDLRDLQDFAIANKVERVRAAIEFDNVDQKFRFTSDRANARDTKLFDKIFYGGDYTSASHPAKWEDDKYLTQMANDWPLHYFVKANTVRLYMSNKVTISIPTTIVCQKRNINYLPQDSDSFLMLDIASGNCERDIKRLTQAVQRAISDIEQISTLKIDLKENVDTMTDYLPKVDFLETNNTISAIRTKSNSDTKTQNFPITSPSDITSLVRQEFLSNSPANIFNLKPLTLLSTLYTVYTAQFLTANTNLAFTQWTSKYLDKNKLIAKVATLSLQIPFLSPFFFPTFNILSQLRPSKNFFPFLNTQTSKQERKKRGISTVLKVMLPFTPAIGAASFVVKTIINSLVMPSKYASKRKSCNKQNNLNSYN